MSLTLTDQDRPELRKAIEEMVEFTGEYYDDGTCRTRAETAAP